jgi:hypothetical protein
MVALARPMDAMGYSGIFFVLAFLGKKKKMAAFLHCPVSP